MLRTFQMSSTVTNIPVEVMSMGPPFNSPVSHTTLRTRPVIQSPSSIAYVHQPGNPGGINVNLSLSARTLSPPKVLAAKLGKIAVTNDGKRWAGTVSMERMMGPERLRLVSFFLLGVAGVMASM